MKYLVVANWKCNPTTLKGAKLLFDGIERGVKKIKNAEVVVCPPFIYLSKLSGLALGAQNCFWQDKGAFTGEISAKMLKDLGCKYVIIGHSERRRYFKETCTIVNKKIKAALVNNLKCILCIDNIGQVRRGLKGISKKEIKKIIIAYEPIFAIGTGKACSIEKARKMKLAIKKILGENTIVLYGGSVNSKNARDFIKKAQFQGLLVGGVSLKPKEFIQIVKNI